MDKQITIQTPTGSAKLSSSLKERLKKCGRYYSPSALRNVSNSLDHIPLSPADSPLPNPRTPVIDSLPSTLQNTPDSSQFHTTQLQPESSPLLTPVFRKKHFMNRSDFRNPKAKRMCLVSSSAVVSVNSSQQEIECLEDTVNQAEDSSPGLTAGNNEPNEKLETNGDSTETLKEKSDDRISVMTENDESSIKDLRKRKSQLEKLLKEKQEHLRKLNMVKMYRSKNDFRNLDGLITKWTKVSQQVLVDLHCHIPEPKPTLTEFLSYLNIDFKFVKFNPENEKFF
ncbi:swi5-dependent recombination DNA repair protein 1 homolog [Argonauta hians]